ncbi:Nitroreductase [Hexamita inflata]|uniref:Nitroreductase n=1 Tax=Hexamita inflata TaxID=28002 RepID=A0AA86UH76_9EUKA|nr:Nitroreductase [Hexamita inflata]
MSVKFIVQEDKCTQCNKCVEVCSAKCLTLSGTKVIINEDKCHKCGHCFSICPTAAISMFDVNPATENYADDAVLKAIQMRHSIRSFKTEMFSTQELKKMLQSLKYGPSAMNARKTRFVVINRPKLEQLIPIVGEVVISTYPYLKAYIQNSVDPIFRGGPHLLLSVEKGKQSEDGIIAISEFELYASNMGLGTCNSGFFKSASNTPQVKTLLGLKEDETITHCLVFGKPNIEFLRPVARPDLDIEIQ